MEKDVIEQYLVVLSGFLVIVFLTLGEATCLSRKGWAGFGKAFGFSALTNTIGFAVGFFVIFVVIMILLMSTLGNSNVKSPAGEYRDIAISILAVIITPILLIISKRIFLAVLKMQTGKSAWLFSVISSVLILIISLGVPTLFGYLLFRQW